MAKRAHVGEIPRGPALPQRPGAQDEDVERRDRLEKDGVGRGGELVGGDEERQGGGVQDAGRQHPGADLQPSAPDKHQVDREHDRGNPGPHRRHLGGAERFGLDRGSAGGEQQRGRQHQPARGWRAHHRAGVRLRPVFAWAWEAPGACGRLTNPFVSRERNSLYRPSMSRRYTVVVADPASGLERRATPTSSSHRRGRRRRGHAADSHRTGCRLESQERRRRAVQRLSRPGARKRQLSPGHRSAGRPDQLPATRRLGSRGPGGVGPRPGRRYGQAAGLGEGARHGGRHRQRARGDAAVVCQDADRAGQPRRHLRPAAQRAGRAGRQPLAGAPHGREAQRPGGRHAVDLAGAWLAVVGHGLACGPGQRRRGLPLRPRHRRRPRPAGLRHGRRRGGVRRVPGQATATWSSSTTVTAWKRDTATCSRSA